MASDSQLELDFQARAPATEAAAPEATAPAGADAEADSAEGLTERRQEADEGSAPSSGQVLGALAATPPEFAVSTRPVGEPLGIRMVNEFVYCPRLFYYEAVEGLFSTARIRSKGRTPTGAWIRPNRERSKARRSGKSTRRPPTPSLRRKRRPTRLSPVRRRSTHAVSRCIRRF